MYLLTTTAASQRPTRVFISSASGDSEFVGRLQTELKQRELDPRVDREGLPLTAEHLREMYAAIDAADVFLFVIGPESIASETCRLELAHAVRQRKRVVPVLHTEVDPQTAPAELARLNWIFFRDRDVFDTGFTSLLEGITIDVEWLHVHTRLLTRALEWQRTGQHATSLLAGADLHLMEQAVQSTADPDPPLTPLQQEFLRISRETAAAYEARRRANVATAVTGLICGAAFLPIALMLSSGLVVLAIILSAVIGVLAAAAFGAPAGVALSLERHRQALGLPRNATPLVVAGLGATILGCVAGLQGGYIALGVAGGLTDWHTLLVATAVAGLLQAVMLDQLVFGLRRAGPLTRTPRRTGPVSSALAVTTGAVVGSATAAVAVRAVIAAGESGLLPDSYAGPFAAVSYPLELVAASVIAVGCTSALLVRAQRRQWPQAARPVPVLNANVVVAHARSGVTGGDQHITRAFISYSRKDQPFVRRLHDGLQQWQMDTWVDWEGIPLTADWLQEIEAAVEACDVFVFVISPDSVNSVVCGLEIAHAAQHHKRLVPVVHREVNTEAVPTPLRGLNPVLVRDDDDFDTALRRLDEAVKLDRDWLHAHTHLLTRALEWENKLRHDSLLLRGTAFAEIAQAFGSATHASGPLLTPLQLEYVRTSWNTAMHTAARMGAWLVCGVFGGVSAVTFVIVSSTTATAGVGLPAILALSTFAGLVGCGLGGLAAFATLQLERAGPSARVERKLPVAMAVLIATLVGSASLLGLFAAVLFPGTLTGTLFTLVNHPFGGTAAAAGVAVLVVRGVVLPHRRLHPFHFDTDSEPAEAEVRRRRSVKRLVWTVVILAILEGGCVSLVAAGAVGPLAGAFAVAGGCIAVVLVAQNRSPAAAWVRRVAPVGAALAGAACGLGITVLASDLLLIPGSLVASLVAANGVLALEPRLAPATTTPRTRATA